MNKKRNYIVNLLMSAISAFLLSYCFFEGSIVAIVCIFAVILKLSFRDKGNAKKPLTTKIKFLFMGFVILGLILILVGKFVFNSDALIIIGAMLFSSIIAPLIVIFLESLIRKIHNGNERN